MLPYLGSNAAVTLMKNLIIKHVVKENIINEWMISIAFTPWPDLKMMDALSHLLQKKGHLTSVSLGVSALVHTYCSQTKNCMQNESVLRIIEYLQKKITNIYVNKLNNRINQETVSVVKSTLVLIFISDYNRNLHSLVVFCARCLKL